jgi:hypothetical protein
VNRASFPYSTWFFVKSGFVLPSPGIGGLSNDLQHQNALASSEKIMSQTVSMRLEKTVWHVNTHPKAVKLRS